MEYEKAATEMLKKVGFFHFEGMHSFWSERVIRIVDVIIDRFGSEVVNVIRSIQTDSSSLKKWHDKNISDTLGHLESNFGTGVYDTFKVVNEDIIENYGDIANITDNFFDWGNALPSDYIRLVYFCDNIHKYYIKKLAYLVYKLKKIYGFHSLILINERPLDWHNLISWYMKRTVDILNALKDRFGNDVVYILDRVEADYAFKDGRNIASELGKNAIVDWVNSDLMHAYTQELIKISENEAVIKTSGCPVSFVAKELGTEFWTYHLHCNVYLDSIKGFNPNVNCSYTKCKMWGDKYCEKHFRLIV